MFFLEPCDEAFASRVQPQHCYENRVLLAAEPEEVFDVVAGLIPGAEAQWFPNFKSAQWLSPPPHGVGSIRDYRLTYMRAVEQFLVWERGRRLVFSVSGLSLPLLRRFLEYYEFERIDPGHTSLRWRVCYEPRSFMMTLIHPIVRPMFARDFREATANLKRYFDHRATQSSSVPPSR